MKVITQLDVFAAHPGKPLVVALGNFDGVHLGHQRILDLIKLKAKEFNCEPAVITFREHPQQILHRKGKALLLTSTYQKLGLLEEAGMPFCFVLEFTEQFSMQSPEVFVKQVLVDQLHAKGVCMGFNARFGHDREGTAQTMDVLARQNGFEFLSMPAISHGEKPVSSTRIRELIYAGDLDEVRCLLGRYFSLFGTVVKGAGLGTHIGVPTANLDPHSEVFPPQGVYSVLVDVVEKEITDENSEGFEFHLNKSQEKLPGVLNFGLRPTVASSSASVQPTMEVHLMDSKAGYQGKVLDVKFIKKIRNEEKFSSVDALRDQIKRDMITAKQHIQEVLQNDASHDHLRNSSDSFSMIH
ncbi:MAG: riboflavin biosynthesis protein RibF [Candidatus Omnitrophica bacterium CG11_big_fil_rev_8_21_14_0_20_45_26]|uniref:Riboflavin biosynthesis protein n=1 Tax=Candidatus Abzuiibacterium crystallinum TaxID=1974748 RepID=A0A2H0LPM8_9BACT|nr:MAG: riboflavin biosynthesis protein RibF [Candidatus Omnitrophica bacterium CG11_big_fil_rev_8_21_14_0_20_45_26]PIW64370.1 MAG: riboflavin biosynthesis protein RibF [Candidatus Omnitrophica bacterium CG12_big_fil_rev_8_21_14_0_65_45_16]